MPSLLFQSSPPRGGVFSGRVLIGRWSINTIVIDDQCVSRIHAWITPEGNHYTITDGSSYNGTLVNGAQISRRRVLKDGDIISIGPEEFVFRVAETLAADVQPIDFAPKELTKLKLNGGFFVDCPCGAPLLAKSRFAGKAGRCRFCGRNHVLAPPDPASLEPGAELLEFEEVPPDDLSKSKNKSQAVCSICQSPVRKADVVKRCPACDLAFHEECWTENRGCAAYGCAQVGILNPRPEDLAEAETGGPDLAQPITSPDIAQED